MLIAGMVVLGIALRVSGLAEVMTELLVGNLDASDTPCSPLILLYGVVLFADRIAVKCHRGGAVHTDRRQHGARHCRSARGRSLSR